MKYFTLLLLLFTLNIVSAQYAIGHQEFTLTDASRSNRQITGHIYYPADSAGDNVAVANDAFPFISFGHGFGMSWAEYQVWWETLVPEGYIIAFATTENSIFPFPDHGAFGEDLAFVINNYMDENALMSSDFYQKISGKNAVMGHSMGGGCSYLADGSFNADVETIISLAAADTDPSAITAASGISVPVLTIAGSADCVVMSGGAPIDIYNGLNSTPYKAYVEITDASHCQFGIASTGSVCTLGEFCGGFLTANEQHNQMFLSASPWLDYFLKGDCDAWETFHDNMTTNTAHVYQEAGIPYTLSVEIQNEGNIGIFSIINATGGSNLTYQWLLDGNPISGATSATFDATIDQITGNYSLLITNENNCSTISDIITFLPVSNQEYLSNLNVEIYPTQSSSFVNIIWNEAESMNADLSIIDVSGKIVKSERMNLEQQSVKNINISDLSTGMYYLRIKTEKGFLVEKILKI